MNIKTLIVYEDENIIIVNKPRGLLTQFDGDKNNTSLDVLLTDYFKKQVHLVNRIDRDTSGLVIFAKDNKIATEMAELISNHEQVEKHYLTLVNGIIDKEDIIDAPLRKSFERKKMVVAPLSSGAKKAITKYFPKQQFDNYTLLDVQLLTGRTHQIRAHMSYIRHHVVGDKKYGDFKINNIFKSKYGFENQFLHAYKLILKDIKGPFSYLSNHEFDADLPQELQDLLKNLNN